MPQPHGATTNRIIDTWPENTHYYKGINTKVGSIINFTNQQDFALDGWRLNQVTKPDFGARNAFAATDFIPAPYLDPATGKLKVKVSYLDLLIAAVTSFTQDSTWSYIPTQTGPAFLNQFTDHYYEDAPGFGGNTEIILLQDNADGVGQPEIFAHIIPARARAMGSLTVTDTMTEVKGASVDLNSQFSYSDSAYDHSAQFLSSYQKRKEYWLRMIDEMGL